MGDKEVMEPTVKCTSIITHVFLHSYRLTSLHRSIAPALCNRVMNMSAIHNLRLLTAASQFKGNNSCEVLIPRHSPSFKRY